MAQSKGMRATTVRFSDDVWAAIADEAERSGVSASQFIREAALARAAGAAGARGDRLFNPLSESVREASDLAEFMDPAEARELQRALSVVFRALAQSTRTDSLALRAQSAQVHRQGRRYSEAGREPALDDEADAKQ
jgi:hypothetical protein